MTSPFSFEWTESEDLADINIVPLVDVLLVLLVIFMITAPIIAHSLDVQLPQATLAAGSRTDRTLVISVDRRGVLAVNEKVMGSIEDKNTIKRMEARVAQWKATNPQSPAFLRADRRIRYGAVIRVMALLRRMGIVNVGLMIERE